MRYCGKAITIKLKHENEPEHEQRCNLLFMENLSLLIKFHMISRSEQQKVG